MNFKILYIFLILTVIVSISSAGAADDANMLNTTDTNNEVLSESAGGTFTDLANQINSAETNVTIEGTYVYDDDKDSEYKQALVISKSSDFTIIGNNLVIDGANKGILNITGTGIIQFSNLTIKNCIINNNNDKGLNSYRSNILNSTIENNGNITGSLSLDTCNVVNNNLININGHMENTVVENNGNISGGVSFKKCNITNYNLVDTYYSITDTLLINLGIIKNNNGFLDNLTIDNEGLIIGNMHLGASKVKNNGEIISSNYFGENSIVNNGKIISKSGNTAGNNITNYGTFDVIGNTSNYFSYCNIVNYGNFTVSDTVYNPFNTSIINHGNFKFNGINSTVIVDHYNIANYASMEIINGKMGYAVFNNNGGNVNIQNTNINNSEKITNNKGTVSLNNDNLTNVSLTNHDILNINGGSFNNVELNNYGDLKISGNADVSGLVIDKIDAKIIINSLAVNYGVSKNLNIKVTDKNANPIKNVKLTLNINRKNYQATTNSNGVATVKIPVLNVGSYTVKITAANDYINTATAQSTIKVSKAKTTVKVVKSVKKSKKAKITIKSNKKAVSKIKIKVKVYTGKKYKTYKLKTNKKGIAKLNTKKLKKGKHKLVITSLNKNYKISKKATLKIR